jgi:16S rRNA (uracil1498-N3)-methyltransferase
MSASPLRVPLEGLEPGERVLANEAAGYVARVHRLGPGDVFTAFDPERALDATARVLSTSAGGRSVKVRIDDVRPSALRAPRPITLLQALGKGDKMDAVVRDATELGATRIVPVLAERGVSRPEGATERARRWRRIAVEAARQSGRGDAPVVASPAPLREALAALRAERGAALEWGACLAPGAPRSFGEVLRALVPGVAVTIAVGPEGGFSPVEIAACEEEGLSAASLGPLVLRTETVCAAVLGALMILAPGPSL